MPYIANRMWQTLVAASLAFVFAAPLMAQSTTDGAISGTVFDAQNAVIANAQVMIRNNGTNAEQTAATDDAGYYRVVKLQPGLYTVSIKASGFSTFEAKQVSVDVGAVTQVSAHLKVGGTQETVEVTGEAPQINYTSQDFTGSLNQVAITNLPINGGRWSNFALLTPGVVSDANGFGLLSFRGISTLLNNNTVDGADNNQAFFSEERGRTRAGYSSPKVAVEEFQVNTSNYSAEYGRAAGGVINTVTKSGTNALHGEAFFYDRDNVWGAANKFTRINVQTAPGVFTPTNFKPTDWRKMSGFGVGGPLIKDRLFLFVAYDWFHHNFPGTAVPSNPTVYFGQPTCSPLDTPGNIVFPCTPKSDLGTLAANLGTTQPDALAKYNSGLTGLNTMLGPVARFGAQNILMPKIDWQISQKNHASFTFNRMRWNSPAGIQTQATNSNGIASFGNDFVKDTWGVAKLVTMISANLTNEVRFQYGRDFEFEFTQPPTNYELNTLVHSPSFSNTLGLPPQVSITNGFTFGVPSFLQRAAFPDETRMQVADTVGWNHHTHTFKFGFDMSHVDDKAKNLRNQFGAYSYSSLVNYFSDLFKPNSCGGQPCYSSFTQAFGPLGFEFTGNDYAMFFQDDWRILPRLSLSYGLRYEYEQMPKPFTNLVNPAIPQTASLPSDKNNFGPHFGFSWDATGSGKTILRGGYGVYYGRIINSTIYNALINTGMPGGQFSFFFTPSSQGAPAFPTILPAAPTGTVKPSVVFFDKHFQVPQVQQFDMTLEHDMGWGTVISLSYLGSLGRELPGFADTNIAPAAGTITYTVTGGGPINSPTLTEPLFTARTNPGFGAMTDIFSGINSSYHALVLQMNHRMSNHVQFQASYTLSKANDFGQNQTTFSDTNDLLIPGLIAAEKGTSINDVPHRFVLSSVATSPWRKTGWTAWLANDWAFAPIFQYQSGVPYSLTTSGTPPGGVGSSINGSGGDTRIDVIGRNTFRRPNLWASDFRLSKSFTFKEKYGLELSGDFFNVANKQDVTGVVNTGYIIKGTTLAFSPGFGTINSTNGSNFTYTPRQIQLGVRVKL